VKDELEGEGREEGMNGGWTAGEGERGSDRERDLERGA
jgi:hypothetical protein